MLASVRRWSLLLALGSSFALVTGAQGNVLIVGPGGFSDIGDAVDAAQDGDTILVRTPTGAGGVRIDGKALTIASDLPSGLAAVRMSVVNLEAGETVVLSRLNWTRFQGALLRNNAGSVRVVGCSAEGYSGSSAMVIESSSGSAAFAACDFVGSDGGTKFPLFGYPGASGLVVNDSLAAVFDSTLSGGDAGSAYWVENGGSGASVKVTPWGGPPARLLLSNSTLQGGAGGNHLFGCPSGNPPATGGPGLFVGAGASARKEASTFAGGAGGESSCASGDGATGEPIDASGSVQDEKTPALSLTAPTLAHEGETITLTFTGAPGDRVVLIAGARTTFQELAPGPLLVHQPNRFPLRRPTGVIGPSGVLSVPYPLPMLPSGVGAQNLFLQGLATHASGGRTLGSFAVVTVLDSAL